MNKLFKLLLVVGFGISLASSANAAAAVRGAKGKKTINASASAVLACGAGPSVLYGVVASTGATSDYIVFRDSNTANTSSAIAFSIGQAATGANIFTFDPPVQFINGISVNAASTTVGVSVLCEHGRVVQGY